MQERTKQNSAKTVTMKLLNFTEIKFQYTENVLGACLEFLTSLCVKNINWALLFCFCFCFFKILSMMRTVGEPSSPQPLDLVCERVRRVIEGCTFYRFWALVQGLFLNLQGAYEIINSFPHFYFFPEHKTSTSHLKKKK